MKKYSNCIAMLALLLCVIMTASAGEAASSLTFQNFLLGSTSGLTISAPFTQKSGTITDPDTVTLTATSAQDTYTFSFSVAGSGFIPPSGTITQCELDWDNDSFGAPADSYVALSSATFATTQSFSVTKTQLGLTAGGTKTVLYELDVEPLSYTPDDLDVKRFISVTYVADTSAQPALTLSAEDAILNANEDEKFEKEITVSANTTGVISDLTLNETSWNDLTLTIDQANRKIKIEGRPGSSGSHAFTVFGKVNGVAVNSVTFSITVSNVATYALTATPSTLSFVENSNASSTVVINSNTGKTPTNLEVDITSWKGLKVKVDDNRITISGKPNSDGTQVFTVKGRVSGSVATPTSFTVTVFDDGSSDDDNDDGGGCSSTGSIYTVVAALAAMVVSNRMQKKNKQNQKDL